MQSPATFLRTLAHRGDTVQIEHLIREGVDPNVLDRYGRSALCLAASKGYADTVQALIAGGAWVDPHEDYDTNTTPLMAAAEAGHLDVVRILVSAGADPTFHVGVGQRTPAGYARSNGHKEVADFLTEAEEIKRNST